MEPRLNPNANPNPNLIVLTLLTLLNPTNRNRNGKTMKLTCFDDEVRWLLQCIQRACKVKISDF